MKWNLIIMLLYSFMWKLQNSPNQNTKRTKYKKWNETWLLCFYTHSCERFKIVQIKIQKGQSIRNEMKWNLIIMLLYSFMWKLQNSSNQNTKRTKYKKWNETWLLCFYTHSCESFKIVQIKIQKGQSIRNEMKWNLIIMLLYSFMWKLQNSPNQNTNKKWNEMKLLLCFFLIHIKASKKSKSKYKKDKV